MLARQGYHIGPPLGNLWRLAHDPVDVDAAIALLARRIAGKFETGVPMSWRCAILVFAKAPVAGLAKTRLIPSLGVQGAARLARRMLDETLAASIEADIGPVTICCTPDIDHPAFADAVQRYGVTLADQNEGDLGERMSQALSSTLQMQDAAIVVGTDCPALDAACLRRAASALQTSAAVFAPATDGGYVLAGLTRPMPSLFEGVAWSTDVVMDQTRKRLAQLGVIATELPSMRDIDVPVDLKHVPRGWLE